MRPAASALALAARAGALLLCLALLLAGVAAGAQGRKAKPDPKTQPQQGALSKRFGEKLMQANELLQNDKFDEALAIIEELGSHKKLGPLEEAQVHRFRGYLLQLKGQLDQVPPEFEQALGLHALDPLAEQQMSYSLAQIYTQLGKYDRALEVINAWFEGEEEPKPDAYHLKAMILVQQENFKAALEPARRAVELEPKPKESWIQLLVAIYSQLQDYPNVATTLQRLISMAPAKKQYWTQLAAVQNYLERESAALATLQLAHHVKLLSEDREYRQLARLLFLRELPYQCARIVEEGITGGAVKPDADSYRLMSNCFLAAREHDLALEPLTRAGELSPDGEMYMLLAQLHLQYERFEPALAALQKALAKASAEQRGQVQLLIGVAQLGSDRFDDAERAFLAASADKKAHAAAESYLKFLKDERLRKEQEQAVRQASAEG